MATSQEAAATSATMEEKTANEAQEKASSGGEADEQQSLQEIERVKEQGNSLSQPSIIESAGHEADAAISQPKEQGSHNSDRDSEDDQQVPSDTEPDGDAACAAVSDELDPSVHHEHSGGGGDRDDGQGQSGRQRNSKLAMTLPPTVSSTKTKTTVEDPIPRAGKMRSAKTNADAIVEDPTPRALKMTFAKNDVIEDPVPRASLLSGKKRSKTFSKSSDTISIDCVGQESSASQVLEEEMQATWQWRIDTDPELAAALGLLSHRQCTHALDPRSLESFQEREQWLRQALHRLETSIDRDELDTAADQLSYNLYRKQLTDYVTLTPKYRAYLCCVNRMEGPQTDLPLYARNLPVKTKDQRQFYKAFLLAIPQQLAEVTQLLRVGLDEQRTPPKLCLEGVVDQIRSMTQGKLSALRNPMQGKFPNVEKVDEKECEDLVDGPVKDAFDKFADFLEKEYIPYLREEISATHGYPNGAQYYADCLAFHTTTDMTPAEIHQLGLDEVQRVKNEMESIAADEGFEDKLDEYLDLLRTAPEFTSESPEALLGHFRNITGKIAPAQLKLFHVKTLPSMPMEIIETPSDSAHMAPAAYYLGGSFDKAAPRPGSFYVNTSELATRRTYECEALALHEGIPGHHTQTSIQCQADMPDFRRYQEDRRYFEAPGRFPFYTGYIEGWALHCETLGEELGLYQHPSDRMGQLSMEAVRSCRLVVDTGMHALGWTKEQAVQYMAENTAMSLHNISTEVSRYLTWPGQATAYKVGERFIFWLRCKAEAELRDKFDPRDFYDVVLLCGAVPLDTLEDLVNQYIYSTKYGITHERCITRTKRQSKDLDVDFMEAMFPNLVKIIDNFLDKVYNTK